MSLHEEIGSAIQREIELLEGAIVLSPTTLAIAVQRRFIEESIQPHIQYTSLEHLKHMARRALAGRYEADGEENESHQSEMFAGHLQDRYPTQRAKGSEPQYKLRNALSADELDWNIRQLRKSAAARLEHADALQAYADAKEVRAA
jgi:hypothetical protein